MYNEKVFYDLVDSCVKKQCKEYYHLSDMKDQCSMIKFFIKNKVKEQHKI